MESEKDEGRCGKSLTLEGKRLGGERFIDDGCIKTFTLRLKDCRTQERRRRRHDNQTYIKHRKNEAEDTGIIWGLKSIVP